MLFDVAHFYLQTLHSICQIAEILLTLQQVGNVKYTGWVLQVRCSTKRQLIDQLQLQASNMEKELSNWKDNVKSQRESFYELNYYTTLQLLTLRKELGRLKDPSSSASISPEVLTLIQSISTKVEPFHVVSAVKQILETRKTQEIFALNQSSGSPFLVEKIQSDNAAIEQVLEQMDTSEPEAGDASKHEPEEDLDDVFRGHLATITARLCCDKNLVLKCFTELGEDKTYIDYEEWCEKNRSGYRVENNNNELSDTEVSDSEDSGFSDSEKESSCAGSPCREDNFTSGIKFDLASKLNEFFSATRITTES